MEVEVATDITSHKRKKSNENLDEDALNSKPKRARVFSVKEFRKQLNSNEKLNALKEFSSTINNSSGHDYVYDYLKNGGNCLELLQCLESDSTIPPALVFDLETKLLLRINASYGQYYSSAHESCRYLINNYLPLVHKMLGLSSSKEERKACLKLLTAMAAFSSNLAKDILINVKFHSANIELLTKHTGETNSVRDCFIHFLTAFLVDGDLQTLSILLEKSGLLTGIISGLQYDAADTVCIVIAAMKNHILENSSVMKTTKMHVFNTSVVKDIVYLYNWKGPEGLKALDKNNRTVFEVDKVAKSKVSECVHFFLLVLCTSHRHGVIFRDHSVGLGKKNQNGLMYTVLESLDRPWEHSYASELVIKICRSCPDLTKNLWSILKPFLQPRLAEKWLNAMDFAGKLIKEMEPSCIEYCVADMAPQQLAQIIEFLVSPSPILKIILNTEDVTSDDVELKRHISILLSDMLEKIDSYLQFVKKLITVENFTKLKQYLSNYIARNYPTAKNLLEDWKNLYLLDNNTEKSSPNKHTHLETILNILNLYKSTAPQLLYNLTSSSLDLKQLLLELASLSDEDAEKLETLQMKIVSIFVDIDHSYFLPGAEIFSYIVPVLLKMYHKRKIREIQMVLHKILKNTGIFDGCEYEVNIWLNGIFNFSVMTEDFAKNFVKIIKNTADSVLEFQQELSQINPEEVSRHKSDNFIETLLDISDDHEDNIRPVKPRHCSPVLLGFLRHLQENAASKNIKKYSEFVLMSLCHCQTTTHKFLLVIQNYSEYVPDNILNYIRNWAEGRCEPLTKVKGTLNVFKTLSENFLNNSVSENSVFIETLFNNSENLAKRETLLIASEKTENLVHDVWYPDFSVDILQMCTFYFSNLVDFEVVSEKHSENWISLVDHISKKEIFEDNCLDIIFENSNLLKHFSVIQFGQSNPTGTCTGALIDILKKLSNLRNIETFTRIYSRKVFEGLSKILKKPKKYLTNQNITKILEVCPLEYKDCIKIISQSSELLNNFEFEDNSVVLEILTYCIERVLFLCNKNFELKPIDEVLISRVTSYLTNLNEENKDNKDLSKVLTHYLEVFPHCLANVDPKLFSSILQLSQYNKNSADLAVLLLSKDLKLAHQIKPVIVNVVEKKGLILPLVEVLLEANVPEDVLRTIYEKLEASLLKAIQKPQKVGQHFLKNYKIGPLIEKFMPIDKCRTFADKAQKFEVTEVFHVKLLEACFNRLLSEEEIGEKEMRSIIMTFIHLEVALFKRKMDLDEDRLKLNEVSGGFNGVLEKIASKAPNRNFFQISNNETFKQFCKFSLKYGVSGQPILLKILRNLIELLTNTLEKDEVRLLLDMLLSHSEFLNVVLGERSETKLEVLTLFSTICRHWTDLMEKSHVAVILSAYRGMVTRCDRTVLALLKLYESKAEQTRFYDFKPFLWGRAAATHYSVRTQLESSLIRQPKVNDVLGIIKEDLVNLTITNHILKESLHEEDEFPVEDLQCYDLKFLLPLFSHVLAPEQQVKTYVFSRCGGLSLTILGLSSQDKEVRQAACHVLSRYHFHLEARQTGKDNLLWIRFVEALCKGAAVLPDIKLNNFASIFYARMALILTNPRHLMYTPLSAYLTAKEDLDLSTVPELYTLLFSSDVNFKEHRNFILEILRDGMRTEKDFIDFLKSMGFKLFSELFSSCLCDADSRLLILDILLAATRLVLGVNILCENYSLLAQLHTLTSSVLAKIRGEPGNLPKLLQIFLEIIKTRKDFFTNQLVFTIFQSILRNDIFLNLKELDVGCFYEVLYTIYTNNPGIFRYRDDLVDVLLDRANDKFCIYVKNFGCKYIGAKSVNLQVRDKNYFLRLLVFKLFM